MPTTPELNQVPTGRDGATSGIPGRARNVTEEAVGLRTPAEFTERISSEWTESGTSQDILKPEDGPEYSTDPLSDTSTSEADATDQDTSA